jgi:hypothetical protein
MQLAVTILLGTGIWVSALVLAISLCRAAKAGDQALEAEAGCATGEESGREEMGDSPQIDQRMAHEAIGFDLRVHPRPTRGASDRPPPPASTTAARLAAGTPATTRQLLSLREAAETLGVTPDVLLAWEARYGYPKPHRSSTTPGRAYSRAEVLALADSLQNGLSIPSAIDAAQGVTHRRRTTARAAVGKRQPPAPGPE